MSKPSLCTTRGNISAHVLGKVYYCKTQIGTGDEDTTMGAKYRTDWYLCYLFEIRTVWTHVRVYRRIYLIFILCYAEIHAIITFLKQINYKKTYTSIVKQVDTIMF